MRMMKLPKEKLTRRLDAILIIEAKSINDNYSYKSLATFINVVGSTQFNEFNSNNIPTYRKYNQDKAHINSHMLTRMTLYSTLVSSFVVLPPLHQRPTQTLKLLQLLVL